MKIIIIPRYRSFFNDTQIELCVDYKLIELFNIIFPAKEIVIAHEKNLPSLNSDDILVISGGNNLIENSNALIDKKRNDLTIKLFEQALQNKNKVIGICYGAQFIAKYFNSTIQRVENHVGEHKITIDQDFHNKHNYVSQAIVNSFHDFAISKLAKNLTCSFRAEDSTIEMFLGKKDNILGIVWHPERYQEFRDFDIKIIKNFINDK